MKAGFPLHRNSRPRVQKSDRSGRKRIDFDRPGFDQIWNRPLWESQTF